MKGCIFFKTPVGKESFYRNFSVDKLNYQRL